ncbi:MAG: hypothetical protein ACM3UY_01510 [Methanocella sp.]
MRATGHINTSPDVELVAEQEAQTHRLTKEASLKILKLLQKLKITYLASNLLETLN